MVANIAYMDSMGYTLPLQAQCKRPLKLSTSTVTSQHKKNRLEKDKQQTCGQITIIPSPRPDFGKMPLPN